MRSPPTCVSRGEIDRPAEADVGEDHEAMHAAVRALGHEQRGAGPERATVGEQRGDGQRLQRRAEGLALDRPRRTAAPAPSGALPPSRCVLLASATVLTPASSTLPARENVQGYHGLRECTSRPRPHTPRTLVDFPRISVLIMMQVKLLTRRQCT